MTNGRSNHPIYNNQEQKTCHVTSLFEAGFDVKPPAYFFLVFNNKNNNTFIRLVLNYIHEREKKKKYIYIYIYIFIFLFFIFFFLLNKAWS